MVTEPITDYILDKATELTNNFVAAGRIVNTPNGIGMDKQTIYDGFVGELALESYLKRHNKLYKYYAMVPGLPDAGDFTLYLTNGQICFADAKTASKNTRQMIMVPKKQFDRKHYDFYIGLRLGHGVCQMCGFCRSNELRLEDVKIPTMLLELDKLHSIQLLLDQIRNNEK